MARQFRIESLSPDDLKKLQEIQRQYIPNNLQSRFMDSIEKTGQVDPSIFQEGNFQPADAQKVNDLVAPIVSKLPSAKDAYQKFIDAQGANEADLTDQELQDRLAAHQGLAGIQQDFKPAMTNALADRIFNFLQQRDSTDVNNRDHSRQIADTVVAGGDPEQVFPDLLGGSINRWKTAIQQTKDAWSNIQNSDQFKPSSQTQDSIKRIQDILASRQAEAAKSGALNTFLAETPAALAASRGSFLAEREGAAQNFLAERAAPQIIAGLNARGLAEGPDVGSEIAATGASIQASTEDTLRNLEAQDNQFFADAAFRLTTAKLNQSEADFRASVAAEQAGIRQRQQQNFQGSSNDITRSFDQTILEREQQRALNEEQTKLRIGQDNSNQELINSLAADTAQNTGQIIGQRILTPNAKPVPSFSRVG